jgi:hypothetical protein
MTSATLPAAFWLLPCPDDGHRLQTLIDQLADAHGTPRFEPHVTLHVTTLPTTLDIESALAQAAEQHSPLALSALATGHLNVYYKALFVNLSCEMQDGPGLVTLRRNLVAASMSGAPPVVATSGALARGTAVRVPALKPSAIDHELAGYRFDPHLSLLYGDLPASTRAELASTHDLHGHTLRFDRIAAVRPAPGRSDLSCVADWDVYGYRRLQG